MEIKQVKLSKLRKNTGQIKGVPKNPRLIKDHRFHKLKQSLEDAPEMIALRELIAYDNDGELVVICGNMRLSAMRDLEYKEAPVKVLPKETPAKKIREYTIKDNVGFGEDDIELLSESWDIDELDDWGMEIELPDGGGEEDDTGEEDPEVEFTEYLGEQNNYIVLKFNDEVDWLQAETLFELKPVKSSSTRKDGKISEGVMKIGTGRVLDGKEAIQKLLGEV